MRREKLAALGLTVTLIVLSGCGAADDGSERGNSVPDGSSVYGGEGEEDPFAEKVELTWLGYYPNNITGTDDTWAQHLMEEAFNVEITPVTDVTPENAGVWISSGSVLDADVVCTQVMSDDVRKLYDQELIREFPEEWLWEYYPTGMQLLVDMFGMEFFENGYHLLDGKCVYVPFNNGVVNSTPVLLYRKDWMENLKLSEPTTLEELHDLLYAFTYDDPDGNGKDDTYGMHGLSLDKSTVSNYYWVVFSPLIGTCQPLQYVQSEDGSVYMPAATEGYREALRILKEWYDEGIMDPECITDDRAAERTKWSNGRFGVLPEAIGQTRALQGPAGLIAMVESVYGEDTVAVMHPLTADIGDGVVYTGTTGPDVTVSQAWYFTADTADEQVIRFLQIQEGLLNDRELYIKILYGEEGVDYVYGEEGDLQVLEHVTTEYRSAKGIGSNWYGTTTLSPELRDLPLTVRDKENYKIAESWPVKYYHTRNIITNEENEAFVMYDSEVRKIATEYYCNVLLGTDNLEEGWTAYLEKLDRAGMNEIIAEYEEMLK